MVNQNDDSVALKPLNRPKATSVNSQVNFVEVNISPGSPLNQANQTVPVTVMDKPRKNLLKIIIDFILLTAGEFDKPQI